MDILNKFIDIKHKEREELKEERAPITLKYYNLIQEMIGNPDFEHSYSFLVSVEEFIEKNEYISDKQIEIIDKVYEHPRGDYSHE